MTVTCPAPPQQRQCVYCKGVGIFDSHGRCMGCGAPGEAEAMRI